MARFRGGYVKLYKKSLESDLFQNPYLWAVWSWLLVSANYLDDGSAIWEGARRRVGRGCLVTCVKEIADHWKCSQRTIRKWLYYLHDSERIILETSPRGSFITICNWDYYQCDQDEEGKQSPRQGANKGANNVPQNEEDKKRRREEERQSFDLDAVYQKYPRKSGKQKGLQRLEAQIKSPEDYRDLCLALEAFLVYHRMAATEARFVPHFATWVSSWRDCLEPGYGSVTGLTTEMKPIKFEGL